MGTFQHRLKEVIGGSTPRNWCFFDVEALINKDESGGEVHTCRLGWGCYCRTNDSNKPNIEKYFRFFDALGFWEDILKLCEKDRKLVIMGYNVGYDFRLVDGFHMLEEFGYSQERIYCKSHVVVMGFKKGKHNIIVLDAMNFFNGKLADWGEMLGVPKGKVDFNTASEQELSDYCKQDVNILKTLYFKWLEFITVNDFGHFSVTRASQSMVAYRHKYMKKGIYIHADKDATRLERESYYGGRTECFFIGKPPFKKFWKLDINSMYPYVMKTCKVPYNLRGVRMNVALPVLHHLSKTKGLIGYVDLETDIPAFPLKFRERICFPIGKFTTCLAGDEFALALETNAIKRVHAVAIYDIAIRFKSYVEDMYSLRQRYKSENNIVFEQMVKYMMNSLYGKFGQFNENWEKYPNHEHLPDGEHILCNLDTGEQFRIVIVAGQSWKIGGQTESLNSFPGIASFITASARVYLWRLILIAGRENVFYTDTDSLIVNQTGYKRLKSLIDNKALGMLKLEYATKHLLIRCPKDYETDIETHVKGVTSNATKLEDNVFEQTQWQGLRGAISNGTTDRVILTPVIKTLKRKYNKGIVTASGYVKPYSLPDSTLTRI